MSAIRWITLSLLFMAAPFLLAGCHDEQRLKQRLQGPTNRLPVEPGQTQMPPVPALLDIVQTWQNPATYPPSRTRRWGIVKTHVSNDFDLTYRVPLGWNQYGDGKSQNIGSLVQAHARLTSLKDDDISLATYASQLADGNQIFQYSTIDGHIVYLTRRDVALAPSDPKAPREVFHTAVVSVDGKIAKLDVRYDDQLNWRFNELASAIVGTLQVRQRI